MWIVETYTICDDWVNCWSEEDDQGVYRQSSYETAEAAVEELMDFFSCMLEADMDFDPLNYRLREIS